MNYYLKVKKEKQFHLISRFSIYLFWWEDSESFKPQTYRVHTRKKSQ